MEASVVPPFQKVHHLCVVVPDADRAMALYDAVGIGPWHDYPPMREYTCLEGSSQIEDYLALVYKWTMVGDLQLQICQPGAGSTPQRRFLDEHGGGVYHIGFEVADVEAAEVEAARLGLAVRNRGRRDNGSGFTYFDTSDDAGVVLEIRQSPPAGAFREPEASRSTRMGAFTRPHHVCLVVSYVEQVVAYYESVGIGPWQKLPPMADVGDLDGIASDGLVGLRFWWTMIGDLQLQPAQPGAEDTPHRRFLDERGAGVFSIGFSVDDVDAAEAEVRAADRDVVLRGRRSDRSGFSYFDTRDDGGVTLMVRQPPTPSS